MKQLRMAAGHLFHVIDSYDSHHSHRHAYSIAVGSKVSVHGIIPNSCHGNVEFSCIDYRSQSEPFDDLFNSFSLKIPEGSRIVVMDLEGDTRIKTAFTGLLQRMFEPCHGVIFLDGHDITTINTQWLRSRIGVIPSDAQLLSLSIADNIAFGDNSRFVPFDEVLEAAKIAGLHDFVMTLPLQYHTVCDGNLLNLEKRIRVSIARVLIRNPRLVILEDILFGFERETFHTIFNKIMSNRTVIYFPSFYEWNNHRIKDDFRIVLLSCGSIIENGSHNELMAQEGIYYNLTTAYNGLN